MCKKAPKYKLKIQTEALFINGEYVSVSGTLLDFLVWMSYTVEHFPFLPPNNTVHGIPLSKLRRRLGRKIGAEHAIELIEFKEGKGYRFNPGLIENGDLIVLNPPKIDETGRGRHLTSYDDNIGYDSSTFSPNSNQDDHP